MAASIPQSWRNPKEPEDFDGIVEAPPMLVPAGQYTLAYNGYRTGRYFGGPKVILSLAILDPDKYAGIPLERFYNVDALIGPAGEKGKFKAPARGHLIREYQALIGNHPRPDRISFERLRKKRLLAEVETVERNHAGETIAQHASYSRVARLVRCLPELC